jgi:arsenate reductase-like glutaredoxin family protein
MDIVKIPPTAADLFELAGLGGISVKDLVNPKSRTYREVGVDASNFSESEAAAYLAANPKDMYRPLLTDGINLVVGFEPEKMETLL